MNSYTELYSVELSGVQGYPEGLRVSTEKTYNGYIGETIYSVSVMDMDTIDEVESFDTTRDNLERDFNATLAKYGGTVVPAT